MHQHDHHHHGHHHGHTSGTILLGAFAITLVFAAVEALGGWLSGSLALLGDAGHMVSDATALGLAAFAAWLSLRPPSVIHSYGFGRAEVIAAMINGVTMVLIVVGIVIAAIDRMQSPRPVAGGTVMLIAAIGLVVNVVLAWLLSRGEQTLNIRGALLHVIGDMLGSVAALAAGAVIYFTGWTPIDPILSVFICVLILFSAVHLLRDGLTVLMEAVPSHIDLEKVGQTMAGCDGVRSVHDLHIWTLSSGRVALSAHVVVEDLNHWQFVLEALDTVLKERFDISHSTIQPEPATQIIQPMPIPEEVSNAGHRSS
jgi:cobalt-zinc-cadmium efflux system protein